MNYILGLFTEAAGSQTLKRVLISAFTLFLTKIVALISAKTGSSFGIDVASVANSLFDLLQYALGAFIASPILKQTALNVGLPPVELDVPMQAGQDVPPPPAINGFLILALAGLLGFALLAPKPVFAYDAGHVAVVSRTAYTQVTAQDGTIARGAGLVQVILPIACTGTITQTGSLSFYDSALTQSTSTSNLIYTLTMPVTPTAAAYQIADNYMLNLPFYNGLVVASDNTTTTTASVIFQTK